jgi:hypothetical protein
MTSFQKAIKYGAIALAIVLIVSIFKFSINAVVFLGSFFEKDQSIGPVVEREIDFIFEDYNKLIIETNVSKLTLKTGEQFRILTNNDAVSIQENNNDISIIDNRKKVFYQNGKDLELIVVLPKANSLNEINIKTGVGKVVIEELNTKKAMIDVGVGEVKINDINVVNNIKINGGAGKITIHKGRINNLNADLGIGEFNADIVLIGSNKIKAGIGQINLSLTDSLKNYTLDVEKGIGNIFLNKSKIETATIGNGEQLIDINGGIGEINIKSNP